MNARTGLADGVLVGEIRLKKIWDLIGEVRVGEAGSAYSVDRRGRVIAHGNPSVVLQGTEFILPKQDGIHLGLTGDRVVLDSQEVPLYGQGLYVVAGRPTSEALALTIRSVFTIAVILAAALGAAGLLVFLAMRQIVRPIRGLATTARTISDGDLSQRAEVTTRDELGTLASAFNTMTDRLRETIDSLEQRVAERDAAAKGLEREITERKRTEEALRESNRRLEDALVELKAAQQQLVQQERLSALGQMASGIAHDFNNALSPIVGFSDLLLVHPEHLDDKEKVTHYLELVNAGAKDATNVVRRLREFYRYREQTEIFQPVNLKELVEQVILLTQPKWKDQALAKGITINVETNLHADSVIAGNAAALREALTNLVFNSVDAIIQKAEGSVGSPEKANNGTIAIRTYTEKADQHTHSVNGSAKPSRQVLLEVSDNGIGMSEDVRRRCLEPFFSTKGEHGTGLGLSMVFGIVQRHEGEIEIKSEWGRGATFIICLPAADPSRRSRELAEKEEVSSRQALHILVVEDEPLGRELVTEFLTADGHTVETAINGREGLEKFRVGRFDLVVTDRAMPEMSGDQLAATIKQAAPKMPVIMLTGFGDMMQSAGEQPVMVDVIVSKPVVLNELQKAVAKVRSAGYLR